MLKDVETQNFIKKLKTYNKTICDKRVLKLVQESLKGNIFLTSNDEELTILDENMLSFNEKNIAIKLAKSKNNKYIKKLNNKFNIWKKLVKSFEILLAEHDKEHKLNKEQNKELDLLNLKLIYILIDLKVNLGLNLDDISINDITNYCNSIVYDVFNSQYETLNIEKHIDEQKNKIINLKQIW